MCIPEAGGSAGRHRQTAWDCAYSRHHAAQTTIGVAYKPCLTLRMPIHYEIVHTTVYHYKEAVTFGEHRVMFRPRDSHDLRVLATDLEVSPDAIVDRKSVV